MITRTEVLPLGAGHLAPAADLLAARHRRDRARDQRLPGEFEDSEACRARVESLLERGAGVAAIRDGRLVGYLLAQTAPPHEAHRRAFVPLEGHAVAESEELETYRHMYAALAPELIKRGLFDHQVHIAALDATASEAFFSLGFGQGFHVASRSLDDLDKAGASCVVRLASAADAAEVARLVLVLDRQSAESPSFMPGLGNADTLRAELAGALNRTGAAVWLAVDGGRDLGVMYVGRPNEPGLDRGPDSAHIFEAFVEPGTRSRGIGTTLLHYCLVWARENGFRRLSLDFRSYNLVGARFWLGHGFKPVSTILQRRLDPRLAWADGSNE